MVHNMTNQEKLKSVTKENKQLKKALLFRKKQVHKITDKNISLYNENKALKNDKSTKV